MTDFADLPDKTLLRPEEVARFCSVSCSTVYRWESEGKIRGSNPTGKSLRIYRESVIQFWQERE